MQYLRPSPLTAAIISLPAFGFLIERILNSTGSPIVSDLLACFPPGLNVVHLLCRSVATLFIIQFLFGLLLTPLALIASVHSLSIHARADMSMPALGTACAIFTVLIQAAFLLVLLVTLTIPRIVVGSRANDLHSYPLTSGKPGLHVRLMGVLFEAPRIVAGPGRR